MTTAATYKRPPAGRKYIEAANAADQAKREAARDRAAEFTDVIRTVQKLPCTAHNGKFKHFLDNELICAHCNELAITILERQHQ